MKKTLLLVALTLSTLLLSACTTDAEGESNNQEQTEQVVNVYTTRHYDADDALYAQFTEETGIIVNVVTDKSAVSIEKIKEQGDAAVADIFMTSDAGNLSLAKEAGILQSITSTVLEENIPAKYRDQDSEWFGLTKRARVFLYSKERVTNDDLSGLTYQSLAENSRWNDSVLVRSSSNMYNQSLLASFVYLNGVESTTDWTAKLVGQMARDPEGNDRDQALAIKNDEGDIAIANSYYYGQLVTDTEESSKYYGVAKEVGIFFPDQGDNETGVHINISGAGVLKYAKNKDNAVLLLEFLSEVKQQEAFSATNYEFPVNPEANMSELLQSWLTGQGLTELKEQELNLNVLGEYNEEALTIMITNMWDTPNA